MTNNKNPFVKPSEFASSVVANSDERDVSKLLDIYVDAMNKANDFNKKNHKTISTKDQLELLKQMGL
ncbi:hypothetical protein KAR41_05835 [Periweissella fabalis]|nr:hypothetical protein [Periweissella fabalis]